MILKQMESFEEKVNILADSMSKHALAKIIVRVAAVLSIDPGIDHTIFCAILPEKVEKQAKQAKLWEKECELARQKR